MSHFMVTVLVPKDTQDIVDKANELLAPYDENINVAPYIYKTREELLLEKEEVTKQVNSVNCPDYLKDYRGKIEKMSLAKFVRDFHGKEVDEEENLLTTYNKKSRWDWYVIGGRWDGTLPNNICPVSEIPKDFTCFAIVTPDGEWHERGRMGWWAIVMNEKDEMGWEFVQSALFAAYKDCTAVGVDLHI